jgi:hypothetical protein
MIIKPTSPRLNSHYTNRGCVGYWAATEGSGETLNDLSRGLGLGGFITINGAKPTWAGSTYGHALHFADAGQVVVAHNPIYDISPGTAEVLFKLDQDPITRGASASLLGKGITIEPFLSWRIWIDHSDGSVNGTVYQSDGVSRTSYQVGLVADTWYHVFLVLTPGSNVVELFVNAVPAASLTTYDETMAASDDPFTFSGGTQRMEGLIAKAALYNVPKIQAEMALLGHNPFIGVQHAA